MFVVLNFKNIIWEHVEVDEGKFQVPPPPFLVVYHILSEMETWILNGIHVAVAYDVTNCNMRSIIRVNFGYVLTVKINLYFKRPYCWRKGKTRMKANAANTCLLY